MKVLVKLNNGEVYEYENVIYVSKTKEVKNIFGNSIEWINIVMQDFNTEKISNNQIEYITILGF